MYVWRPELAFQAVVFLRFGHNHPAHPQSKPSTQDDRLLDAAMRALGSKHLSVRKLLTGVQCFHYAILTFNELIFNSTVNVDAVWR
jgi:hypothetical protein